MHSRQQARSRVPLPLTDQCVRVLRRAKKPLQLEGLPSGIVAQIWDIVLSDCVTCGVVKPTKVRGARKSIQSSSREEGFLSAFSQFSNSLVPSNSFRFRSGIPPHYAVVVKLLEGIRRGDMRAVSPLLLRGMSLHMIRYRCLDLSYSHVDDSGMQAISYLSSCLYSLSLRATKVRNHTAISQLLIFAS